MKGYLFFCVLFGGIATSLAWTTFPGAKVLTLNPVTEEDVKALKTLMLDGEYDFWTPPTRIGKRVDIMATGDQVSMLKEDLTALNLQFRVKIGNLDEWLEENRNKNQIERELALLETRDLEWTAYHTYEEINDWMDSMGEQYPDLVSVVDAGLSYYGNPIKRMLVSTGGSDKPVIFVESGCHAREWIGPATATYIMNELITNSSAYQDSLDVIDFVFMPEVNPDGYIYTWETDRLWKQNRRPLNDSNAIGVDLNRNYGYQWEGEGATMPSSPSYRGPYAFSETETQAVRDQMLETYDRNMVYISFQSALEKWLRPWSYTIETPGPDEEDVLALCEDAIEALYQVNGIQYVCILGGDLYPSSGVSSDYAKGVANFKYSYTVELRDQGYGFVLPPEQIIPSEEETFAAFKVIFEFIRDNPSG